MPCVIASEASLGRSIAPAAGRMLIEPAIGMDAELKALKFSHLQNLRGSERLAATLRFRRTAERGSD